LGWGILLISGLLLSLCGLANTRLSFLSRRHSELPVDAIVGTSPT
jgi:hypothetical protein